MTMGRAKGKMACTAVRQSTWRSSPVTQHSAPTDPLFPRVGIRTARQPRSTAAGQMTRGPPRARLSRRMAADERTSEAHRVVPSAAPEPHKGVPFGLLDKVSRRGGQKARFFCVRDSILLQYEAGKEAKALWDKLRLSSHGFSAGGWKWDSQASVGRWAVESEETLWKAGGESSGLSEALDIFHPRGVVPLVGSSVQPSTEDPQLIVISQLGQELRLLCLSKPERDGWLAALRGARDLNAHTISVAKQTKGRAEEARDAARAKVDSLTKQLDEQREELNAHKVRRQLSGACAQPAARPPWASRTHPRRAAVGECVPAERGAAQDEQGVGRCEDAARCPPTRAAGHMLW